MIETKKIKTFEPSSLLYYLFGLRIILDVPCMSNSFLLLLFEKEDGDVCPIIVYF
jgi:hypothetical protein